MRSCCAYKAPNIIHCPVISLQPMRLTRSQVSPEATNNTAFVVIHIYTANRAVGRQLKVVKPTELNCACALVPWIGRLAGLISYSAHAFT